MKRLFAIILTIALVVGITTGAMGQEWTGTVNLFTGIKTLDSKWEPADHQTTIGVSVDFRRDEWPINVVTGIIYGYSGKESRPHYSLDSYHGVYYLDGSEIKESETIEILLGLRKIFECAGGGRPFIGGGISYLSGELDNLYSGIYEKVNDGGYWIDCGIFWVVNNINFGLEIAKSGASGLDLMAGGTRIGLIVGYNW